VTGRTTRNPSGIHAVWFGGGQGISIGAVAEDDQGMIVGVLQRFQARVLVSRYIGVGFEHGVQSLVARWL
jgi:hypothetical protein